MHNISETAQARLKILAFWKRRGLAATMDAFGVSRRALYYRHRAYRIGERKAHALNNRSRAPLRRGGKRVWEAGVLERLLQLRAQMPAIGLKKLRICLLDWCEPRNLHCPGVACVAAS